MPAVRRLPNGHMLRRTRLGDWVTDDGKFSIESDLIITDCDGANSRSGYCPGHGWKCPGEKWETWWTVWNIEKGDHIDSDPYPYQTFGDALNRLKGEYQ